jgi:hypothetical protein
MDFRASIVGETIALESAIRHKPGVALYTIGNTSYSIYLSHLLFSATLRSVLATLCGAGSGKPQEVTYVAVAFIFCRCRWGRGPPFRRASDAASISPEKNCDQAGVTDVIWRQLCEGT